MMDERMILKSDVERVLSDYRENQEAILDEETKELVTRSRLGNVTFWVRFVETEDGYLVHRAYSHRMNMLTGTVRLLNDFGLYTDISEPDNYMIVSDVQHVITEESEVKLVQVEPDYFEGIDYEKTI